MEIGIDDKLPEEPPCCHGCLRYKDELHECKVCMNNFCSDCITLDWMNTGWDVCTDCIEDKKQKRYLRDMLVEELYEVKELLKELEK